MSNSHKEIKHHEFVLANSQHINVNNPVNEETIKFQQEKTNMIIFSTEKTCNTLLAPMQNKHDINSYIQDYYGLISLAKLMKMNTTVY
jgi:hypothetical protein